MLNPYLSPYDDLGIVCPKNKSQYRRFVRIWTFLLLCGWGILLAPAPIAALVPGLSNIVPVTAAHLQYSAAARTYFISLAGASVLFLAILFTTPTKNTDYNHVFANDMFQPQKYWPPVPVRRRLVKIRKITGVLVLAAGAFWAILDTSRIYTHAVRSISAPFQKSVILHTSVLVPVLCAGISILRLDRSVHKAGHTSPPPLFQPAGIRECIEFRKAAHAFYDVRIQIFNTVTVLCIWLGAALLVPDLALHWSGGNAPAIFVSAVKRPGLHPGFALLFLTIAVLSSKAAHGGAAVVTAADKEDVFVIHCRTVSKDRSDTPPHLCRFPYHVASVLDTQSDTVISGVPVSCAFVQTFRCLNLPQNVPVLLFSAGGQIEVFAFQHISYVPVIQPFCMRRVKHRLMVRKQRPLP